MNSFIEKVKGNIQRHGLMEAGTPVLAAVSGGMDSMALLRALCQLSRQFQFRVHVGHLDHQLRVPAGAEDCAWLEEYCRTNGLPFVSERIDVAAEAKARGVSIEMAARDLRMKRLAAMARNLGCGTIALGHHLDDRAEWFLLKMLKGAGKGMHGMRWRAPCPADSSLWLARPLLDIAKEEIRDFIRVFEIPYREDESNSDVRLERNWIRHRLSPLLREFRGGRGWRSIKNTMEILAGESELMESLAEGWLAHPARAGFDRLAAPEQRRVIRIQLERLAVSFEFRHIEWLRLRPSKKIGLPGGRYFERTGQGEVHECELDETVFCPEELAVALVEPEGIVQWREFEVRWSCDSLVSEGFPIRSSPPREEYFDAEKVGQQVVLRHWRPGDRFQPIGMGKSVKLKQIFGNLKIPKADRRRLLIAATREGEIFWVQNLRISERFKLDNASRKRLKWHWRLNSRS